MRVLGDVGTADTAECDFHNGLVPAGRGWLRHHQWAVSEAVQIHGGYGYMMESPVARFYCDAKVLEIGEGTNEIQHLVIARDLIAASA